MRIPNFVGLCSSAPTARRPRAIQADSDGDSHLQVRRLRSSSPDAISGHWTEVAADYRAGLNGKIALQG